MYDLVMPVRVLGPRRYGRVEVVEVRSAAGRPDLVNAVPRL